MKIVLSTGGGDESLTIDGRQVCDMSNDEKHVVLSHVFGCLPVSDLAAIIAALADVYAQRSTVRCGVNGDEPTETLYWDV